MSLKRFDCPSCSKPLRFRLLPHVPRRDELAFACPHCGAVLGYEKGPWERSLMSTPWRRVATVLVVLALLSAISALAGRAVSVAVAALLAVVVVALHLLSRRPAYRALPSEIPTPARDS